MGKIKGWKQTKKDYYSTEWKAENNDKLIVSSAMNEIGRHGWEIYLFSSDGVGGSQGFVNTRVEAEKIATEYMKTHPGLPITSWKVTYYDKPKNNGGRKIGEWETTKAPHGRPVYDYFVENIKPKGNYNEKSVAVDIKAKY